MNPSVEPFNEEEYKALMDGLECSILDLQEVKKAGFRFDSDYYSKSNLKLSRLINEIGTKTIGEYGGSLDCSAFYPSITGYYSNDRNLIPFLRVNEIKDGLVAITDNTVFLPPQVIKDNSKTIALAYPGDIIIAKGGNTLAKVGLVTNEYPQYATCRDVITLRTNNLKGLNKYYLWAFLHSEYGQRLLWRSASQTGQPHLTLPSILNMKMPCHSALQNTMEQIYEQSVALQKRAEHIYNEAEILLSSTFNYSEASHPCPVTAQKMLSDSFIKTGRLDAEYYQPKYDKLFETLACFNCKPLGGDKGIVRIKKSIEPGSEAYQQEGIPFVRVSDVNKYEIARTELFLDHNIVNDIESLYPKKDTILFSKDGSVGIAYKVEKDSQFVTSGALLHLIVRDTKEVLPDYLTLVLNSPIVQMQAERDSNGAIIQHWKPSEIEQVVIPVLDMTIQETIAAKIQESFALRRKSKTLLEYAKQAVEMAIERGEDAALNWLNEKASL